MRDKDQLQVVDIEVKDKLMSQKERSKSKEIEIVEVKVNGEKVTYEITGVIIHTGKEAKSGHYVYNYIDDEGHWAQLDDDQIIRNDEVKKLNSEGSIFVLKKAKGPNPWSSASHLNERNHHIPETKSLPQPSKVFNSYPERYPNVKDFNMYQGNRGF